MEDQRPVELRRQIDESKSLLVNEEVFGIETDREFLEVILRNQIAIMKNIERIDDMITKLPL